MEALICGRCLRAAPDELFDRELWWGSDYGDEGLPPGWRMVEIGRASEGVEIAPVCEGCVTPADVADAEVMDVTTTLRILCGHREAWRALRRSAEAADGRQVMAEITTADELHKAIAQQADAVQTIVTNIVDDADLWRGDDEDERELLRQMLASLDAARASLSDYEV